MSKISYALGDQIRRLGTWLAWNPLRLLALVFLLLVVWLVLAGQSTPDETPLAESTATVSSDLPDGWESWPKTTVAPR